jgi:hypothetical protein
MGSVPRAPKLLEAPLRSAERKLEGPLTVRRASHLQPCETFSAMERTFQRPLAPTYSRGPYHPVLGPFSRSLARAEQSRARVGSAGFVRFGQRVYLRVWPWPKPDPSKKVLVSRQTCDPLGAAQIENPTRPEDTVAVLVPRDRRQTR